MNEVINKVECPPVLFLVFNRLDTTREVFQAIRQAKPSRLYIGSDGPRKAKENEAEKVNEVRGYILANIDWECEVKTLFREENLGCRNAVSSAITWFFDQEEMGIILEDDCLPSQSFFKFCAVLLEKYKDNNNIGIVSGSNFLFNSGHTEEDYYFSVFSHVWGWATWRKVWANYDISMKDWPTFKQNKGVEKLFYTGRCINYWNKYFDRTYKNQLDTWDYQLSFMTYKNNYLNISPMVNLISNIGFSGDATHTTLSDNPHANMPRFEIQFPLKAPHEISRAVQLDLKFEEKAFRRKYFRELVLKVRSLLKKFGALRKSSVSKG